MHPPALPQSALAHALPSGSPFLLLHLASPIYLPKFNSSAFLDKRIYGDRTKLIKILKKNLERSYFHVYVLKAFYFISM